MPNGERRGGGNLRLVQDAKVKTPDLVSPAEKEPGKVNQRALWREVEGMILNPRGTDGAYNPEDTYSENLKLAIRNGDADVISALRNEYVEGIIEKRRFSSQTQEVLRDIPSAALSVVLFTDLYKGQEKLDIIERILDEMHASYFIELFLYGKGDRNRYHEARKTILEGVPIESVLKVARKKLDELRDERKKAETGLPELRKKQMRDNRIYRGGNPVERTESIVEQNGKLEKSYEKLIDELDPKKTGT